MLPVNSYSDNFDQNAQIAIPSDLNKVFSKKWALDFTARNKGDRTAAMPSELPAPLGYIDRQLPSASVRDSDPGLMVKRSWDIALGPIKQVPMNLFIMWMAGNSISIFPIMMVIMMFLRPIQAIFSMQSTFQMIEGNQAPLQCFTYFIGNVLILVLALYKCHTMGLLPTYASDWLAFVEAPIQAEFSGGGITL